MSDNCSHDCDNCSDTANTQPVQPMDFTSNLNPYSKVKKAIAVVSGKGGVGKSLVTSLLAVAMNKKSYSTAILDADITGPSIPRIFGLNERVESSEFGMLPVRSKNGISVMSVNLLLDNETDPVIWRGPMIANTVKRFWSEVVWSEVDYMFIDMPPGTGDVPLTVFQSMKIDGIVIVTSPQDLVSMIVTKAVNMAKKMDIPIFGVIENMSYYKCPDCGSEHTIFGKSRLEEIAKEENLPILGQIPIDSKIAEACDNGNIEDFEAEWLENFGDLFQD